MNVSTPFHPRLLLCLLVVAALLAPTTHASAPPASTVTVDSTKPGCKRNPRRVALERHSGLARAAELAADLTALCAARRDPRPSLNRLRQGAVQ